nr:protein YgfX [Nitrogeniibacter aestuarii]
MSGELKLNPPSHLWLPVSLLVAGAVFLLISRSEAASQVLALLAVAMAAALIRHWRGLPAPLVLAEDGVWYHPLKPDEALRMSGSSARLSGVFWLHGQSDHSSKNYLMVLPSMLSEPDYRRLCVWYSEAAGQGDDDGTVS